MKLIESLLDAISRLEGDALILHVGEKPYVVTSSASMYAYRGPVAWGHVELSSRVLTTDAVVSMLEQLLPPEQRKSLDEYGAVEYQLSQSGPTADGFTVIAARGGDDVWLEIRRTPAIVPAIEVPVQAIPDVPGHPLTEAPIPEPTPEQPAEEIPIVAPTAPEPIPVEQAAELPIAEMPFEIVEEEPQLAPTHAEVEELFTMSGPALMSAGTVDSIEEPAETADATTEPAAAGPVIELPPIPELVVEEPKSPEPVVEEPKTPEPVLEASQVVEPVVEELEPVLPMPEVEVPTKPAAPAVVVPLSRSIITSEPPVEVRSASGTPVERILRIAAARGAATVYVVARSQPVIRVDGEISVLDGEPPLTAAEIERLVMDLAPARARDSAAPGEWMTEVPDVGRVRCVTFRDHRGPGVIFRMIPPKAISADQLGISAEVQALCAQPDGLVLVTGARASGKSTLLSAFVDLINRTRSDHVITIESQIGFVHESRKSFVSQREVRGASETVASAVRSAFREDPDVLVIEDLRTPEIVSAALEAAESGRLVFGSVSAVSTVAAIDRLIEMFPPDRRPQAQTSLASALRGVVAQTLLRKVKGGRMAAREVLLNTPAVASLILEGKTFQLPVALASGRRHGMIPFADSMAALVREGTIHAAEAYRKAPDREALLAALRRDGVDTSFTERLA